MTFKFLCVLVLVSLPLTSNAECPEGLALDVALHLQPQREVDTSQEIASWAEGEVLTACELWPGDPKRAIVALALFHEGSGLTGNPDDDRVQRAGLYDLDVLVVNTDTGESLSRLMVERAISSDSNRLNKISIDTGHYTLAPAVRAFGVRLYHSDSRREYSYSEEHLNLYVMKASQLKLVLNAYQMGQSGGDVGECGENYSDTRRTLAIGKASTLGYADLIVTTKTDYRETKTVNSRCVEIKQPTRPTQDTLRFNGEVYQITPSTVGGKKQ